VIYYNSVEYRVNLWEFLFYDDYALHLPNLLFGFRMVKISRFYDDERDINQRFVEGMQNGLVFFLT
jgi:hypothetical protein